MHDKPTGIGLTPVVKESPTNTEADKKNKNIRRYHNNGHNAKNSKNSNSPLFNTNDANNVQVPIETQLQYSRNGHAVLRNMIPLDVISNLRSVLVQHASTKSLDAWRQKVEVSTNSASIASSCQSIQECQDKLMQLNNDDQAMPPTLPFLQHFNTWRTIDTVRNFVTSPLMAKTAQQFLDVPSVKLYQDSLFWKRCNDGPTPWHSDARMAPFDTSHMITFWIPLQYIPKPEKGGTGLWFVDKSHADFALPYWNHNTHQENDNNEGSGGTSNNHDNNRNRRYNHREYDRLEERYGGNNGINHHMPLQMGDCTVHAGWTLHCSDAGYAITTPTSIDDSSLGATASSSKDRFALAVTYVDARAEIRHNVLMGEEERGGMIKDRETNAAGSAGLGDNEDRWSFQDWVGEVKPREYFKHDLVPIVWPTS